ncbi:unnamed protein product [Brassica oleracea]
MFCVSASLLRTLDVGYNLLTGKLPKSLQHCSSLIFQNVDNKNDGLVEARRLFNQNQTSSLDISTCLMSEARQVFDQMPVRDVVSWNTMPMGLKKTRDNTESVLRLFLDMRRSSISGVYTGSALLRGYTSLRDPRGLERVFEEILVKDVVSWNVLIMGYMKLGFVEDGERAFGEMPERNIVTWHTMLIGYVNNVEMSKARDFFDKMSQRNVFSWTVMINSYVQRTERVQLYRRFLWGRQMHSMITKRGMDCDVVLSTSLVDMYAKSGDITGASRVFKSMLVKNPASWNSMIGGFARHGLGVEALEEFERMVQCGYKPDQVTFINLLSACAHAGLVEEGEKQFMLMGRFGISAEKEHYACMVDLLARAGQLDKAERLIKGTPFEPDFVIWGALLGACGLHSCLELGEVAAKGISRLRREYPAAYDVLCRVHGEKRDWTSVMELRRLMRKTKAKKQDASSWIE